MDIRFLSSRLLSWIPAFCLGLAVHAPGLYASERAGDLELMDLSLDQLMEFEVETVYGAARHLQRTSEAPAAVTIVGADAIQVHGLRTLADILRTARGLYVTNDRNYSYLGVRGFSRVGDYNTRILLLIDGHRINDNVYEAAPIGADFPLDVDLIERVEIVRGPASSVYGTDAFLAVVNVVTRRGRESRGLVAAVEAGNLGYVRQRLTYGAATASGFELLASSTFSRSDGQARLYYPEFDAPETHEGMASGADAERFGNGFLEISGHGLTFQALYGAREKRIPTASFGTVFNDPRARTLDQRGYADLRYERKVSARAALSSRLTYDHCAYDGDWPYAIEDGSGSVLFRDSGRGAWSTLELALTSNLPRQRLACGSELTRNYRQDQRTFDENPFFEYLDEHRSSTNWGLYVQDVISILPSLRMDAGTRYDHYESFGGTVNPRLGLIYSPSHGTTFKLLYGSAFRAPNAYERFYTGGGEKPNPGLDPERIHSREMVVEHRLGEHVRISGSVFHSEILELVNQEKDESDGLLVFRNIDEVDTRGAEGEIDARWESGLRALLAYSFASAWSTPGEQEPANSPRHLLVARLRAPVFRQMWLGLDARYTSARRTLAGTEVGAFAVSSASLMFPLPGRLEAALWVQNLGDARYFDPGSEEHVQDRIEQDGRTIRFRISRSFQ